MQVAGLPAADQAQEPTTRPGISWLHLPAAGCETHSEATFLLQAPAQAAALARATHCWDWRTTQMRRATRPHVLARAPRPQSSLPSRQRRPSQRPSSLQATGAGLGSRCCLRDSTSCAGPLLILLLGLAYDTGEKGNAPPQDAWVPASRSLISVKCTCCMQGVVLEPWQPAHSWTPHIPRPPLRSRCWALTSFQPAEC